MGSSGALQVQAQPPKSQCHAARSPNDLPGQEHPLPSLPGPGTHIRTHAHAHTTNERTCPPGVAPKQKSARSSSGGWKLEPLTMPRPVMRVPSRQMASASPDLSFCSRGW